LKEEHKAFKLLRPIWSAAQTQTPAPCPTDIDFSAPPDFLLLKRERNKMKITYDKQVDAIYIGLSNLKPEGVIEVADGINIDVTSKGKVVGIELLDATHKVSLDTLLTYEIAADTIGDWVQLKRTKACR